MLSFSLSSLAWPRLVAAMSNMLFYSLSDKARKCAEAAQLMGSIPLFNETKRSSAVRSWLENIELIQEACDLDDEIKTAATKHEALARVHD
ncbi:hypothetical protein GQ54DRAFT_43661 [Martensiomyces pterosporus]|nr:hypothetical protein GQ54DRAFT_43661 [Martensiomyces pterosporus]